MKDPWFTALGMKCLCSFLWLSGFAMGGQVIKPESFYMSMQHAIFQLQYVDGKLLHTATAFFVKKGDTLYVVSAGHVARDPFSYAAILQLSVSLPDGTPKSVPVRFTMPHENWILHAQQ